MLLLFVAPDIRLFCLFAVLSRLIDHSTVPVTVALAARHLGAHRIGPATGLVSAGHAPGRRAAAARDPWSRLAPARREAVERQGRLGWHRGMGLER